MSDGFLVLDKPAGPTSHDVVALARRAAGTRKAGHTGTLDPLATGVLVVALGAATKVLPYLAEHDKTYQVEAELGSSTDTQDCTGRRIQEDLDCEVSPARLARELQVFVGSTLQLPPMYSAVQIKGERLYKLAREGREIEREPRRIEIFRAHLDWPDGMDPLPLRHGSRFGFTITCGRGTYVRTICHDLGARLGCGAHLVALRRLSSGSFRIDQALSLADLAPAQIERALIPIREALSHLPLLVLDGSRAERVRHGNALPLDPADPSAEPLAQAVDPAGRTIAILKRTATAWQPLRVLAEE